MEQKRESPESPHLHGPLVSYKGTKVIQQRKDSFFNQWYRENWTSIYKKMNSYLIPH